MSLENQGVFQFLKDVTFRGILAFYSSREWGHFGDDLSLFCSLRLRQLVSPLFSFYVETNFVLNPADGSLSVFAWIKGGSAGQTIKA